jgi:peroxiredoxin
MGRQAPELNLSIWIDGNGKKTESIGLSDYRGKVVYLYFFQDW